MNTLIKLKLRQTALLLSFWNGSYYLSSFFATCLHDVLTLYFIEMSFDMFSINTNYQLANKNIIKIDGWEMVKWIIKTNCRFVCCHCWVFFFSISRHPYPSLYDQQKLYITGELAFATGSSRRDFEQPIHEETIIPP